MLTLFPSPQRALFYSVTPCTHTSLVPGSGRSPGEGKGYPLQYFGLENSMDYIVHGVAKSWTWLSDFPEKAMAPHSRTLAWKIPRMEEPGRLQSMGSLELDTTERLHFHFSLSCIGEGNGNPLQCSCLENPRDGEAWLAAVYGVAQSRTRLRQLSSSSRLCESMDPTAAAAAKSRQSCPTLCNLIDGSPPGSPVPGVLQARTLEWVAISFSNACK